MKASYTLWNIKWKGQEYGFVPNQNFWLAISIAFTGLLAWTYSLWTEFNTIQTDLLPTSLSKQTPETPASTITGMSGSIFLAASAVLNFVLRKLINLFLKANNIALLGQAKINEFQNKPLMLRIAGREVTFRPSNKLWYGILIAFGLVIGTAVYLHSSNRVMKAQIMEMQLENEKFNNWFASQNYKEDVMGYFMEYFNEYDKNQQSIQKNYRDAFLIQKQLITTQHLIKERASRIDQLSNEAMLAMNTKIADLFKELVLDHQPMEDHVYTFFTDSTDLNKLVTALTEQGKFHVPASIKLAQAALETAYGKRVINNNYFGIKDKTLKSSYMATTEYYNEREMKRNKSKILSMTKVKKGGKLLYKCKIRDSFMDYGTPWKSFRAHSVYLAKNERYAPLFAQGKNYEAWAEKIGSTKYGGVGYATSPIYGNLLKKIIKRYNLDLLDY